MLDFLSTYSELISTILLVLVGIILFCKTGNKKYLERLFMENIKNNSLVTAKDNAQSFDRFKPVYRLNKSTNELELTDEVIDLTELANSCKDMCINSILERFFPTDFDDKQELVSESDRMLEDLDTMNNVFDLANAYRDKFGLSSELSVQDVFNYVKVQSDVLKDKIKNYEVKNNEKEIIEESK